ncbi:MAG: hypothetical protein JWN34_3151 [Bryobacterales bacterium]|nr:hypothetical protein [Bryobacterales bacterium]
MFQRGPNKKIANSLVAMSSAAVLAVYAAGYTRTKSAADRMDAQSVDRRPGPNAPGRGASPAPTLQSDPAPSDVIDQPPAEPVPAPKLVAAAEPRKPVRPPDEIAPWLTPEPEAPTHETTKISPPEPAAIAIEHKPEPVAPAPPPPQPPPAPAAAPKWKDGTYTGWGTSRHGDIQASVVIEDGRIKSATIAQCLTRYSCDIIDKLPPQVAQRQSPETDYVSGATQSTNAFYYGVVDALSKAK